MGTLPLDEFDALLARELYTVDGRPINPVGLVSRLFAGLRPEPAMYALAEELRSLGIAVALLSNSWGNDYPRDRIAPIFELTLSRLGLPPHRVLFVDDAMANVEGARVVGLPALLHTDPATTRAELARLIPGLRPTAE
jgi:putative hydrolase of the HAD superfamily